jgi:putative membrane protein
MDVLGLLGNTLVLRPYVFLFLALAIVVSRFLMGGIRTLAFFLITWIVAFVAEFSSTRTGVPFGWYAYTGATHGQELYLSNIPFMDSLSFTFLLFASYCLSLLFVLPGRCQGSMVYIPYAADRRMTWPVVALSVLFFALIDVIIDPVALRGDRWFLGKIYEYPYPGVHFGVPLTNYLGWAVVGVIALSLFRVLDGHLRESSPAINKARPLLWGAALYYAVLAFNLALTFWIGETLLAWCGIFIYLPVTALLLIKLTSRPVLTL